MSGIEVSSHYSKRPGTRKQKLNIATIISFVALGLLSAAPRALAHHALNGRMPANFFEGFISGLAHPIIGLDHFAFVVAVGFLAIGLPRGAFIPGGFVGAALAGTGIHLLQLDLPGAEIFIASSVITFGAMLLMQKRLNFTALAALTSLAGLFHGYAYGEAIVGAQMTPLLAYLLGFSLIQYVVALLALLIGTFVTKKLAHQPIPPMRIAGLAICSIGVVFLTSSLMG